MLVCNQVDKKLGQAQILFGINLNIARGEITALLGPSGGGKSTLLRALSLLDPPDAGSITVEDHTYKAPWKQSLQKRPPWPTVTVVFQQLFLWPHLSLQRNITLPLEHMKSHSRLAPTTSADEIDELLERFHLEKLAHRFPNEVSIGQRQLIAMIRSFVLKPKYLLLDEVTSALDVEHVSNILEYLKLLKSQGTGILLATHLIGFAKSAADQIVFIDKGRIVETGDGSMLTAPRDVRLSKFLALVEAAS